MPTSTSLIRTPSPDAGGIWEKHCETQLKSVGWIPILPEIWQSVFYHPELELMLVVYVDDFKMAGPTKNMGEGWKGINSVLDMDPSEALGRYFGCNHVEQQQVQVPKSEHGAEGGFLGSRFGRRSSCKAPPVY